MIDKRVGQAFEAISGLREGHSLMVGGFGSAGLPSDLIQAVLDLGVKELTVISNNAGYDREGVATLIAAGRVRKLVCSYPLTEGATAFRDAYRDKRIELELVPQGTLVERIRCAGAGLGGFLSPITVGTPLGQGKPVHTVDGVDYVLELPLRANYALIRARLADRFGNLTYHLSGRNFNPIMATAADTVVAEVDEILPPGGLDPESIGTPSIFVDALVVSTTRQVA
jgi:3-oxoadipate CoA-transferase alpha subunit